VIAWVGLALLLLLCLPFSAIQKLVLEVSAWTLRLALLALLGAAAYLWFRPQDLPVQVADTLQPFPGLGSVLPEPGAQHFGICAAALVVVALLPLLAVLDVSRQVAGRRLRRLRALAAGAKAAEGLLPRLRPRRRLPPPRAGSIAGPRRPPSRGLVAQAVRRPQPAGALKPLPWTKLLRRRR